MITIQVQHLTKTYRHGPTAANDVTFDVEAGEVFGLLGPNGAGKTTVIGMLTGQIKPSSGRAVIAGHNVVSERNELKGRIGVVFEHQNLYERLSGRENLLFFAALVQASPGRVDELLEQFGLHDRARDAVNKYSRGMKQRLLLARAMLDDPPILFLDEPTSGLDPHIAQEVHDLIRRLRDEGKTILLATHYMEEASKLCQRVAILNRGKIIEIESPHRLMVENGRRALQIEIREGDTIRSIELPMAQAADEVQRLLREGRIVTIHSIEASLQEVFIKLTGEGSAR